MFERYVGYGDCVGCGDVTFVHPLCAWCQAGAYEHNYNPDSIFDDPDFDVMLLRVWADTGGLLAAHEAVLASDFIVPFNGALEGI